MLPKFPFWFLPLFLLLFSQCNRPPTTDPVTYNILYLSVDDLGPFLRLNGDSILHTPNFTAFAKESVFFSNAHCQVALCTPSRTSILTGIRPNTSGILAIDDDWRAILPDAVSLPRHFRDHGYYVHSVGKIYDTRCGGMDDAFDYDDPNALRDNDRALTALQQVAEQPERPFFLALGYAQPHTPWEPAPHHRRHYDPAAIDLTNRSFDFRGELLDSAGVRNRVIDHHGAVTEVDSLLGEVLDRARALGLLQNTIVVMGSLDHGFNLGWRGKWNKGNNFDPETGVPLFIRLPDNPANGQSCAAPVELVDLYPTLLDLCALPDPPQPLAGHSLRPLLNNPDAPWPYAAHTLRAYHPNDFGVKTDRYTLVSREESGIQLFDRRQDPLNFNNLADQYPEIVDSLLRVRREALAIE